MAGVSIELKPVVELRPVEPRPVENGQEREVDALVGYFRLLGEKHRLQIFRTLMQSELCVCDLEEAMGISPSLLAHHLKVLRRGGLIQVRRGIRDARWLYYSVDPEAYARLCALLADSFPARELPPQAQCGSNCRCG
jgi:ArsR family transcriptional regulator, arsenate/arsenite/antimonite-responsive transcriptional repressor